MAWGMTVAPTMPTASSTLSRPENAGTKPCSDPLAVGAMRKVS